MIASWGRWPPGSNEPALDPRELGEWEVNEIADCAAENGDRWDGKHGKAVRVQTQRTEQAEDGDVALHLAVENNSGQPIVVNVQEFSANRCQMAAFFASKVAAGETSHAVLTIPAGELERYGLDTVEEASFSLAVFHGDTLERILTTEQLHVDW